MNSWLLPLGIMLGIVVLFLSVGFVIALIYPR